MKFSELQEWKNNWKWQGMNEIHNEIPNQQEWKIDWKWQEMIMRFTMKSTNYKNENFIESSRKWIWNLQWNPQATRMKNWLKAAGNRYKICNENSIESNMK